MNRRRALFPILLAAGALAGCIPWTREVLVQPSLEITVVDTEQRPLQGARVLFVAASNPHHVLSHTLDLRTDERGRVVIEEKTRSETVYPLMMHGVPFYYWVWCAEKDGYQPVVQETHDPMVEHAHIVVLQPGPPGKVCRQDGGRVSVGD